MENNAKSKKSILQKTVLATSLVALLVSLPACKDSSIEQDYNTKDISVIPQKNTVSTVNNLEETQLKSKENIIKNVAEEPLINPFSKEEILGSEPQSTVDEIALTEPSDRNNSESINGIISINLSNVYVVDGDTIYGDDNKGSRVKVRMTGIDAPESTQLLGDVSKLSLQDCVDQSSDIKVIVQADNQTDMYERTLGKVVAGSSDCNLWQVGSGMAWFYSKYANQLGGNDAALYEKAEQDAKEMRAGIWMEDIEYPWEYRRK